MATECAGWIVQEKVSPTAEIQQGDLVLFTNDDPFRKLGVVVTADCDLRQRKHGRLITLVPVVELNDILEYYLLLEQCDRRRDLLLSMVVREFAPGGSLDLEENVCELRAKLTARTTDPDWHARCLGAKLVLHELDKLPLSDYVEVMSAAGVDFKAAKLRESLANQVKSKGDLLVLPSLATLGLNADIAWVRRIWQAPLRNIVFRTSESGNGRGQCIARLDSPYRYRLTQLMGQVFSDIGVPDSARDFSAELTGLFPALR